MKKYTITAVALLVCIAVFCAVNIVAVGRVCQGLTTLVNEAERALEDGDALERCRGLNDEWQKRRAYLSAVCHHDSVESAERDISGLFTCLDGGDLDDYRLLCSQIRSELEHIAEEESLKLYNVLTIYPRSAF